MKRTPRMTTVKAIEPRDATVYVTVTQSESREIDRQVEVLRGAGVLSASRSLLMRLALSDLSDETVHRFAQGMRALEAVKKRA